jgi:hypothetical protein
MFHPSARLLLCAFTAVAWSVTLSDLSKKLPGPITKKPRPSATDCLQVAFNAWPDTARDASGKAVAALGPEQALVPDNQFPDIQYLPDEGSALMPAPVNKVRLLMAGPGVSYLFTGTGSLGDVRWTQATKVLDSGALTDFDNGYAGTSGAWTDRTGKVWCFYHAEDHVDIPFMEGTQIHGFYASIGLATSKDSGKTWKKLGQVIRTKADKIVHDSKRTDQGAAEPGVVASPDGNWLYVDWSDHSRLDNEGVRICLSRFRISKGVLLPNTCRTWDGTGFKSPCLGGVAEPVLRSELIFGSRWQGDALEGHPTWVPRLGRYVMVFGVWPWLGVGDSSLVGTYAAFSTDMIHWDRPVRLIHDLSIPQAGRSLRWEATLLPDGNSKSTAWLVYGHTPRWPDQNGGRGHRPVRRKLLWLP